MRYDTDWPPTMLRHECFSCVRDHGTIDTQAQMKTSIICATSLQAVDGKITLSLNIIRVGYWPGIAVSERRSNKPGVLYKCMNPSGPI